MKITDLCIIAACALGAGGVGFVCAVLQHPFISTQSILIQPQKHSTLVLDDAGSVLYQYEHDKRHWVSFENIPPIVIEAFLSAEDHDFFHHKGISWKGILRSFLVNIINRKLLQGASTISQQVVRLIYLSRERSFIRKIKEICMALSLERNLSKEQIMELYINNIYFGRGIYGIEAAAQKFWKKPVNMVDTAEAATLAAVAKSARFFSPLNDPVRSIHRRNTILYSMLKRNVITENEYAAARNKQLFTATETVQNSIATYYKEWIRLWCEQQFGPNALYEEELVIHTTLNKKIQEEAEKIFHQQITELRKTEDPQLNGGLITIDGRTGAIKATIGGFDFKESQFNRCFQAYRQLGSSYKPFVFAAALIKGIPLTACEIDEPLTIQLSNQKSWTPQNWNHIHAGSMSYARALARSNNIIAAKLLQTTGYEPLLTISQNAGLWKELKPIPALALGTVEATVAEAAAAFNIFAQNGIYAQPHIISHIKNKTGRTLYEHKINRSRIIESLVSGQINSTLAHQISILNVRTKSPKSPIPMIGKTGSTNNAKSMWFVGATPSYTTAVYIGRDDNMRAGHKKLASKTAYPIWRLLQDAIEHPIKEFQLDPHLVQHTIDAWTGEKATTKSKETLTLLLPQQ